MRRNGKVKPDRDGSDSPRAASENTPEPFRRNRRTADAARGALPSEPGLTGPNGREEPWLRHGKPQVRGPVPNPDPWNRQAEGEAPPEPIRKPDGTGRLTRHVASASRLGDAEAGRRPPQRLGDASSANATAGPGATTSSEGPCRKTMDPMRRASRCEETQRSRCFGIDPVEALRRHHRGRSRWQEIGRASCRERV